MSKRIHGLAQQLKSNKGFTLIELMIVVAIIGILAAIAIPNFLTYQKKAKTAEAKSNLGGIRSAEIAYFAENSYYVAATAYPTTTPTQAKTSWGAGPAAVTTVSATTAGTFANVGFSPQGSVYYQYAVDSTNASVTSVAACTVATGAVGTTGGGFKGTALGDLDAVGTPAGRMGIGDNADISDCNPGKF
jgi:type IV pilus assembly protein PilA